MIRKLVFALLGFVVIGTASAQVSSPSILLVTTAPSGSCGGLPDQQVISTGTLYTCQGGTWGAVGGSGTFNALTGDATSTATGGDTEVVGLLSHALPSLTAGYLNWTGSAWALSAVSGSGVSGQAAGVIGIATNSTTIGAQSHINENTSGQTQVTQTLGVNDSTNGTAILLVPNGVTPTVPTSGFQLEPAATVTTPYEVVFPGGPPVVGSDFLFCPPGTPTRCVWASSVGTWVYADLMPSTGCTVSSVVYTTNLDCAWYMVVAAGGGGVLLGGKSSAYVTKAGLVEPPTGGQVSMFGTSSSGNGSPSTVQAASSGGPTGAVISHAVLATGQSMPYGRNMGFFNIDANNVAASCADFLSERASWTGHIACRNALGDGTSTSHFWRVGTNTPGGGNFDSSYQNHYEDIQIQQITSPVTTQASVTCTGSSPTCVVNSAGSYVNATPPVLHWGVGQGQSSCTSPGTWTATMAGSGPFTVAAVTTTATGCGTEFVQVADMRNINYAFLVDFDTDSSFKDIVTQGGVINGIKFTHGGNTTHHLHPIEAFIGIQNDAPNQFSDTVLDSNFAYGVDNEDPNSSYVQSMFTWNSTSAYIGSGGFYLGVSPNREYIAGNTCGNGAVTQTGYHQFVNSTAAYSEAASTAYPGGFTLTGDVNCDNLSATTWYGTAGFGTAYLNGVQLEATPNYYTSTTKTGIGPTSFTPTHTLDVFDATPTTGSTQVFIKAGAGQSGNIFDVQNNAANDDWFTVDGFGGIHLSHTVVNYAGDSSVERGLVQIQASTGLTYAAQTAAISSTTFYTTPNFETATQFYEASCNLGAEVTGSATAITLTLGWTDPASIAKSFTSPALSLVSTANVVTFDVPIVALQNTNITLASAYIGTGTYSAYCWLKRAR